MNATDHEITCRAIRRAIGALDDALNQLGEERPAWEVLELTGESRYHLDRAEKRLSVPAAAELVRQYETRTGPAQGDPYDADLWAAEVVALLKGGA
jgi:hypothetical protein